jgi:hypothetical protein
MLSVAQDSSILHPRASFVGLVLLGLCCLSGFTVARKPLLHEQHGAACLRNARSLSLPRLVAQTRLVLQVRGVIEATQGLPFLRELKRRWDDHNKSTQMIRDILMVRPGVLWWTHAVWKAVGFPCLVCVRTPFVWDVDDSACEWVAECPLHETQGAHLDEASSLPASQVLVGQAM